MLRIDLQTTGLDRVIKGAEALTEQQLKWAVADAMSAAAKDSQENLKRVTPQYVDKPTPFTLNSIYRWPGYVKPDRLSVEVGFKDLKQKNQGSTRHYLLPMVQGTARPATRGEQRLRSISGFGGMYYIPANYKNSGINFNSYGNPVAGTHTRVLSRIKAFNLQGFNMNRSKPLAAGKADYFAAVMPTAGGRKAGIYFRVGRKKRGFHTSFYLTRKAPQYKATFPVSDILHRSFAQSYQAELRRNITRKVNRLGL
jgi:hypothetical protein